MIDLCSHAVRAELGSAETMTPGMQAVIAALAGKRFSLEDEKRTQAEIAHLLLAGAPVGGVLFWASVEREVRIAGGVIDFMVDKTGIEVKLKGQPAAIVRQLKGYAAEPVIDGLVLVTAKPIALGPTIGGKPVAVFDLGRAWL